MTATNVERNHYMLKGNFKNESWVIRNNKSLFVIHKGIRKRLRYCEGETSIFFDEQDKESQTTYLAFEHGSLLVDPNDKIRNLFLQTHPDFNVKFYLFNEQETAANELIAFQIEDDARLLLKELDNDQKEAVATVLFGMNAVVRWSTEKIMVELYKYLKGNPTRLVEVINDPATELTFLVSAAIKLGVIEISADKTSIRWNDSKAEIIPVPRGVNPLTEMSQYLRTTDALVTLQEIGDRINEKKGIKVAKKPTTAKGKS